MRLNEEITNAVFSINNKQLDNKNLRQCVSQIRYT